jgi:hypothetical protein
MARATLLALAFGAAPGAGSCDASQALARALAAAGRPTVHVVDAATAADLAAAGGTLVEARGDELGRGIAEIPGATAVRDGAPLAELPAGRTFVVVSQEPELALKLGARLAREGAGPVAVVADGLPGWGPALERSEAREE